MVVLSTASPYKFPRDVLTALGETAPESDFAAMAALNVKTGCPVPASLSVLNTLPVRFNTVIECRHPGCRAEISGIRGVHYARIK